MSWRVSRLAGWAIAIVVMSILSRAAAWAQEKPGSVPNPPDKQGPDSEKKASVAGDDADEEAGLAPFPEGPREQFFVEKLGAEYKIRRTAHFVVFYNTDPEVISQFAARLEATYKSVRRFVLKLKISFEYPTEKLPVIVCKTDDEFIARKIQISAQPPPGNSAGQYVVRENYCIFADMAHSKVMQGRNDAIQNLEKDLKGKMSAADRKNKARELQRHRARVAAYQDEYNQHVVQHEVAHQLLHNFGVHMRSGYNPSWFAEGLATLFEPPPGANGAGYNIVNQYRLGTVREHIEKKSLAKWKDLVGTPRMIEGDSHRNYAQAWALTFYIVKQRKEKLNEYIALVTSRSPRDGFSAEREQADFERCFGPLDDALDAKVKKFIMDQPYRGR